MGSQLTEGLRGGDRQQKQNGEQQQEDKKNPFGSVWDGAKGLWGKAKNEVQKIDKDDVGSAVGKAGRAIGDGAEKFGAGEIGRQAREIGGSSERMIKGNATQADRERLLNAGIEAGKLAVGGGSLNVAEQVLKRGGGGSIAESISNGLGGLLGRGAKEVTKLDTQGFVKAVQDNWDTLDPDKDGFISMDNIKNASNDKIFALRNAHMLSVLESMYDTLSNCSNDEFGSENNGIAVGDIKAIEKGKMEGTGFGGVAAAADGAWDSKYVAGLAGGGTAFLSRASGAKMFSRGGMAVGAVAAVGGIYGTIDYYSSRKGNIEKVISELK